VNAEVQARRLALRHARLQPPPPGRRLRVVIDTDAANEIDDQFALAWALLRPDRLDVLAVYAAPYSFEHRRQEMLRGRALRDALGPGHAGAGPSTALPFDHELLAQHRAHIERLERAGHTLESIAGWPIFCTPREGMQRSEAEIRRVFAALGLDPAGRVFEGSSAYLSASGAPPASAATGHLIAAARATPPDGDPLYVVAIGCPTNVASALVQAPDIAEHIVVVWTSGWPSYAPHVNFSLNLEQDLVASRVLLDSGVPLVYLPGFQVGAQLRLSLPEVERFVAAGRTGAIGRLLHALYLANPLAPFGGFDVRAPGFSWVIWDLINIAWLIEPAWVPSTLVPTPALGDGRRWVARGPGAPLMREAHAVARDAIFRDLFAALARAPR
jgi:inosine-uridine nucleoside N-ribohydrolase